MFNKELFKSDCLELDHDIVVQKHLLDGPSYFFEEIQTGITEFEFKREIADSLRVHIRDIVIVGSGKLGFSLKPDKEKEGHFPFLDFDAIKNSDIDIAIVSNVLFDNQMMNLYKHTNQYQNTKIWANPSDKKSLGSYILKGWLVPKYIPQDYQITDSLEAVRSNYKMKFGRDVNIGIYKSWFYFENYHVNNVRNIHLNLSSL